ncbi:MAG TPA: hypothetical protein VJ853_05255 [Thermoanaerobaculia bacterium]|nr:hypothetical protein [Thermoanaerobaculia bacterium]
MTEELMLLEAALFQLKSATASIKEMQLTVGLLANTIEAAAGGLSAAAVNDIEFALNDVNAAIGDLSAADADRVAPIVALLQQDLGRIKQATSLSAPVIASIRAFQSKLKARRAAIERATYRPEGAPEEPLPHPPDELQRDAVPLRQQLAAAGFATPALDAFIAEPSSLRFHSINEIVNELDVIAG